MKTIATITLFYLAAYCHVFGSQLLPTNLSDIGARSELIVVAKVVEVRAVVLNERLDKPYDEVTLMVATVLKGQLKDSKLKIITEPRGMRDFDPALEVGQSGVFFLVNTEGSGFRLTASGAAAIFDRGNFVVKE